MVKPRCLSQQSHWLKGYWKMSRYLLLLWLKFPCEFCYILYAIVADANEKWSNRHRASSTRSISLRVSFCPWTRLIDPDNIPYSAVLVLGRDDLRPCTADDREYLFVMMQAFVPPFVGSLAPTSSEYLPGDARNLCIEVANRMGVIENDSKFQTFIEMYRGRYVRKPLPQRSVVELCLLHVLKMPFELNSSIKNSLIRY